MSFTSADTVDPVVDLFDMMLGGTGRFAAQPFSMAVVVHVVPPLRFSPEGCEIMERAIERGMIIQTCSADRPEPPRRRRLPDRWRRALPRFSPVWCSPMPSSPAIRASMRSCRSFPTCVPVP